MKTEEIIKYKVLAVYGSQITEKSVIALPLEIITESKETVKGHKITARNIIRQSEPFIISDREVLKYYNEGIYESHGGEIFERLIPGDIVTVRKTEEESGRTIINYEE